MQFHWSLKLRTFVKTLDVIFPFPSVLGGIGATAFREARSPLDFRLARDCEGIRVRSLHQQLSALGSVSELLDRYAQRTYLVFGPVVAPNQP